MKEIIHPVVYVSALIWFIRYLFVIEIQFLNNVMIIIKMKANLPQT